MSDAQGIQACMRLNAKLTARLNQSRMDILNLMAEFDAVIEGREGEAAYEPDSEDAAVVEDIRQRWLGPEYPPDPICADTQPEPKAVGGLWRNNPDTPEGKYLVKRRDGTVPEWPFFVMGARDLAAPAGLKAYANEAAVYGYDPQYVADVLELVEVFRSYRRENGIGNPDGARHRKDDPATVAEMRKGRSA